VPLATSLGPKFFFVHIIGIPIASSNIIGRWLVLSSHKQLRFWRIEIKRFEQWPLVMWTWNCVGGYSLCMAHSSAHFQRYCSIWSLLNHSKH
jgi:hypothetical protein